MTPAVSTPLAPPLVIRFGAFGDMILMIPALKLLQHRYGAACDVISSGRWTAPLLLRVPAVREGWLLSSRRAPYWLNRSQRQLVQRLRTRPPGPVYVFEPDDKPLSWLRRAGIDAAWVCTLRDIPAPPREHILEQGLRLARGTPAALNGIVADGSDSDRPDARPTLHPSDRQDAAEWCASRGLASHPLVLIQPGNKKTMKGGARQRRSNVRYWPEEKWAAVIAGVQDRLPDATAVICGAPSERSLAADIVARLPVARRERVAIATDDLPLVRLLAVLERAHSMISVDTGPAHAAAAMGCPLTVLFTRHPDKSPDRYAPVPTTAVVRIVQPNGTAEDTPLDRIDPAAVLEAWRQLPAR